MAFCTFCGREMLRGTSCSDETLRIGDGDYEPIRWGDERGYRYRYVTDRCGDCGVPKGGVHHHGCDLEQCPACLSQAIGCGCMDECEPRERSVAAGIHQSEPAPTVDTEAHPSNFVGWG